MIKIENTEVFGWEAAIRGMRNPKNSWDKSDSYMGYDCKSCGKIERDGMCKPGDPEREYCQDYYGIEIGPNDLDLMKRLVKAGKDHGKFMRMIHVQMDVIAPLYWWKEYDTYKVATVSNSCSTMHKIQAKEFSLDDFSHEHLYSDVIEQPFMKIIDCLNFFRSLYLQSKNKEDWWQMIQLLPSSYNQKRTLDLNYATLREMYFARRNHKLDEWHVFCDWIETLPYAKELIVDTVEDVEKLKQRILLLERENKALADEAEMKCDLNHDLQKQVDKLACKLSEIAEYAPCCVNVCPIGNPSNCNAECEESDKWKEWCLRDE